MLLSANENFPRAAVDALRNAGHEVYWVRTEMAGACDEDVLAHAERESRVLVTFDKDFGELAFRTGLPATCGIILFRISTSDLATVASRVCEVVESRTDWTGQFTVVTDDRIRMRELPAQS